MASNKLIIVESPTKVHTIRKFLGSGYEVIASQGHIRDLPKSTLGVDCDRDFAPHYIMIRGKGNIVAELKKAIKKADKIYLATDPDREGEAISWHLTQAFDLTGKEVYRITFNEITKDAVKNAIKNPRPIDEKLVDAQQARRIMDRVVGYQLSPILWKKVKGKLSAGRVQSAVLKIVCDREEEIKAFVPTEYWSLEAVAKGTDTALNADFYGISGRKTEIHTEKEALQIEKAVVHTEGVVSDVKRGTRVKAMPYPFTTSTLQQEASTQLNFATQKTMRIAQSLYEGVKVTGRGTIGLITYLRTDSTRVSKEADRNCKEYIRAAFGHSFVGAGAVKNRDNAQDAHEAIRPTDVTLTPEIVKGDLQRDAFRLYELIWKRFVASRMKPAEYETCTLKLTSGKYMFSASSAALKFKGFLMVYKADEEKTSKTVFKNLADGDRLSITAIKKEQHFTQPVPHFTEASLVRCMEEEGLGRPSTYAPTITHMLDKHYLTREGRNLYVTELGEVVNSLMVQSFPDIVDKSFTAGMEKELDDVAEGTKEWQKVMAEFYPSFAKEIKKAEEELTKIHIEDEVSDETCEKCGRRMVIKYGPHGKFLACPGFPECRNIKSFLEKTGIACPKCGEEIVIRRSKKGRRFYGCSAENCDFISWSKPKGNS